MNNKQIKIISLLLIFLVLIFVLMFFIEDQNTEDRNSQFLVPEQGAYIQASVISKLVSAYGDKYYSNADFWSESTVNKNPLKLYDTNGILYQYLFTVSNKTQKLGLIAISANKSLGMPVMAIDDGEQYLLHYYEYKPKKSHEELSDYIDKNHPYRNNPEIKDIIHDLFRVSAGIWISNEKTGDNLIINEQGNIYNLSLTVWNKTTPVLKNYDLRYVSERVGEWETINGLFNKTYNELNAEGINLSKPLSDEDMDYFKTIAGKNDELYNASNKCRPFCLPPVYTEDEPASKLFHEYGASGFTNTRTLKLFFNSEIPDKEIRTEISGTVNKSRISSVQIYDPDTVNRFYIKIPISKFNNIRTDLILDAPPLNYYRVSGQNMTIFYSSRKDDISRLIREKYNVTGSVTDAKVAIIRFKDNTNDSYVEEQRKKLDSNEKVIVAGYV